MCQDNECVLNVNGVCPYDLVKPEFGTKSFICWPAGNGPIPADKFTNIIHNREIGKITILEGCKDKKIIFSDVNRRAIKP